MYKIIGLTAILVTGGFGAEFNGPISIWGGSAPHDGELNEALSNAIRDANRNPTRSRSVTFKPFRRYWSNLDEDSALLDTQWTWRVNVSDVVFPLKSQVDGGVNKATYATSTTWDFSWPQGGNISSALDDVPAPLCMAILTGADPGSEPDFPVNMTNAYVDDGLGGVGCVKVLGEECVRALLLEEEGAVANYDDRSRCDGPAKRWTEIPECASSLGYAESVSGSINQEVHKLALNETGSGSTNTTDKDAFKWTSGYGFHGRVSGPVHEPWSREFFAATNQLQVLMMYVDIKADGGGHGGPELYCMRVNTTELPDIDVDGDGVALTSEVVLERNNGHILGRGSVWVAFLSAALVALATC